MQKRSSIFWGILLVILAIFLLLIQLNIVQGGIWDYFWPSALILLGLWMLIGYFEGNKPANEEEVHYDIGNFREIIFKIEHGAGKLNLHGGIPNGKAFSGTCVGGMNIHAEDSDDRLKLKLRPPSQFWDWAPGKGLHWDLGLTPEVPLKINIDSGASSSNFDLSNLLITDLNISTGASSATITLPAHAGFTTAKISTGVSSVKVLLPEGVSARIRVKTGLSSIQIDESRFPRISENLFQSVDFETASNRLDITIECGVGIVEVI